MGNKKKKKKGGGGQQPQQPQQPQQQHRPFKQQTKAERERSGELIDNNVVIRSIRDTNGLGLVDVGYISERSGRYVPPGHVEREMFPVDLEGFPVTSRKHYNLANDMYWKHNNLDLAIQAAKRGCETTGCMACIKVYTFLMMRFHSTEQPHLLIPWLLEGSIRGSLMCMRNMTQIWSDNQRSQPLALEDYWYKRLIKYDTELDGLKEARNKMKYDMRDFCVICSKKEDGTKAFSEIQEDGTTILCEEVGPTNRNQKVMKLERCGNCRYYCYCSKECQMKHWMFFDHISECRQLQILKTYHRPYAKEIELKLKEGVDAKDIEELQDLRDRLGLTRPKEDFIKILQICDQITSEKDETLRRAMFDVDNCPALRPDMPDPNERKKNLRDPKFLPYAFVVGEKNGKVHIGSTSEKV